MDVRTGEIFVGSEVAKKFAELPANQKHMLQEMFRPPTPTQLQAQRVGRNDPCPCDSGKKFKKCCYFGTVKEAGG